MVTENGGNVPQRAAIGSEVEYMLVAVAVVGVNAELSGRMCGEALDETSVSVGLRLPQARAAWARGEGVLIAAGRCSYCPRRAYYHTPHGYLCEICAEGNIPA